MKFLELDLKKDISIEINEDSEIFAVYVGKGTSNLKSKIIFEHSASNIKSRINIKAVLLDNSFFDLEVLLKISKNFKNIDTYLKIDCLVIGDKAFARAIPSLEISENEVKAGHGATMGYIEPEILNYLSSKGFNKKESENIIINSFIGKDLN